MREEQGISLSSLAAQSGVSKGYISTLENATEPKRPSGKTLYSLAEALGVTVAALLGHELVADPVGDLPPGLQEFATSAKLPSGDVKMLASIQFRGERPQTAERWGFIYNAIRGSRDLDKG